MTDVVRKSETDPSSEPETATGAVDDQLVGMLVERASAEGLQLTKRVLESALEGEITDHLGWSSSGSVG